MIDRETALTLAQARPFVAHDANRPGVTDGFQEFAQGVLARIDAALVGTIHDPSARGFEQSNSEIRGELK